MDIQFVYQKIYKEFFEKYKIDTFAATDFTNKPPYYLIKNVNPIKKNALPRGCACFIDQEPIYPNILPWLYKSSQEMMYDVDSSLWEKRLPQHNFHQVIFVSERSEELKVLQDRVSYFTSGQENTYQTPIIYWFYHGYASCDNYREYWKENISVPTSHDKLFICYQNVINPYRWHRIQFQLRLKESGLIDQGLVSYNPGNNIKEVIWDSVNMGRVNKDTNQHVIDNINLLTESSSIDSNEPNGSMSTWIDIANCQRALVHVVSETCFYNGKLHLTEKIFKPIVAMQPFLLLGAKGNLAYLREYGFKTFSEFWDESYDDIIDNAERIDAVYKILQNLSELSYEQQCNLRKEMTPILEHNANIFYYKLKNTVINELTTNLKKGFVDSGGWNFVQNTDIAHLNKVLKY